MVKKGQIVCRLDSAGLQDQLVNQKITVKAAEASYENAKLAREVAEIAVVDTARESTSRTWRVEECGHRRRVGHPEGRRPAEADRLARRAAARDMATKGAGQYAHRYCGRARPRRPP